MEMDDHKFQKLTPINDANLGIYKDVLDFVFANDDIKNVGISGAYSAGKSSVIESYKLTCHQKCFLHISLTYFESVDADDAVKEDREKKQLNASGQKENVLEGKILNQLIHQIDPNSIPQTNFRVKHPVSKYETIKVALEILLFSCALVYTLGFSSWKQYINNLSVSWLQNLLSWSTNSVGLLFSSIAIAVLWTLLVYNIVQLQKNKSLLKKVSVQGNEIEIFEQSDDSYFDKYLNEVLYLFENSNADVIVFEDMDRYNANQIFQRLREVNTLINNRRKKKQQVPLRFFYLLRDDIFVSKDRTKFFDFIIPIVPIMDGSNSYDQFIAHFKEGGFSELFDENFLHGISLYVDDMRILKNIYNEFVIYNNRISTTEQDYNKLLALIVYKNLFPRDFCDLQLNRGFIYTLFSKKDEFISNELKVIGDQIEELEAKIQAANNEILRSDIELNTVYEKSINNAYGIHRDALIKERDSRKEVVRQREDGSIEKIKLDIANFERNRQTIQNKKLCEIINKANIDTIFKAEYINEIGQTNHFNEIKGSEYFDLVKYLIRNGFIDETYQDYMTYFYENSLSRIDKVFLRSVTDEKAKDYTYSLKNPEMVVHRLRSVDFEHEETINFDLFCYLLQAQSKYPDQLNRLMLQLKANKNLDFIGQFFAAGKETKLFVYYVNHHWPQLFKCIIQESNFSDSKKKQYALASIYFSPNKDLMEMNTESVLSEFIANRPDFLQIDTPKVERIIEVLELLQIKFAFIEYKISDQTLWSAVYSHNLYELNIQMIETILENQYHLSKNDDYVHKNYSLVLSQPREPLVAYVKDNMEQYMEVMLKHCNSYISDHEEAVALILNDETVSDESKTSYIGSLKTTITSLRTVTEKKWWPPLIEHNLLLYSVDNVLYYFFSSDKNLDSILVDFINEYGKDLNFKYDAIQKDFGEGSGMAFFNAVVQCNSLQNSKYKAILRSLNTVYSSFSTQGITDDKIDILIDLGTITMIPDTLKFMRENYRNNILHFIEANIQKYAEEVIEENNFLLDEALAVLNLDVEDRYKIHLLGFTEEPISIIDKEYTATVETYILENNNDIRDLSYLLQHYDILCESSKETVERLVIRYKGKIISDEYNIPYKLLKKLISARQLQPIDKLQMFALTLPFLSDEKCKECLEKLQRSDYLSLFDGKRPKFMVNDINQSILSIFKEKGWITKFDVDNDETDFYRAIGRKPHGYKKRSVEPL